MKVLIRLNKGKQYICSVKANSQLDAAAIAIKKVGYYGVIPFFNIKG